MEPLPATVTVSPDLLAQELDGETVLLDLHSERYYVLDDVGTRMWQLLSTLRDPQVVCGRLLEEYEIDEATLRHDLGELIAKLEAAGMIQVA